MEPLFLKSPTFEKVAGIKMSQNPDEWMQDVVKHLNQAYPWLGTSKIQVHFNRTDPEEGAGVGQIQLDDKVSIPIIIDKFAMQPLDVFWFKQKLHPLTKASIQEALQNTSLGEPVEPGQGAESDVSLFSRTQAPYDGRYAYASQLDVNSDELFRAALDAFDYDGLAIALKTNPIFKEVMTDWVKAASERAPASTARPQTGPGRSITKEELCDKKGPKAIDVNTKKPGEAFPYQGPSSYPLPPQVKKVGLDPVKKAGLYDVPMADGVAHCLVADNVISMDGTVRDGVKLAVELNGNRYHLGENIIGTPKPSDKPYGSTKLAGWGTLVLHVNDRMDHIVATEPIFVKGRARDDHGLDKIAVDTIHGSTEVHISPDIKAWSMIDGTLCLSDKWAWMPLGKAVQISDNVVEQLKLAAMSLVPVPEKPKFHIQPRNLFKEASVIRPMRDIFFVLSNVDGSTLTKIALQVNEDDAKKTVDTVLGLNFVNDENAYKYAEQLDKIADAKQICAKLLVGSRLGLDLDQTPLKTAMYALDSVERDLRRYAQTLQSKE